MDDFRKYQEMEALGAPPTEIYQAARADGLDGITRIRLLRSIFNLSLVQAKEVGIIADGLAPSLEAYQERLVPILEQALEQLDTLGMMDRPDDPVAKK